MVPLRKRASSILFYSVECFFLLVSLFVVAVIVIVFYSSSLSLPLSRSLALLLSPSIFRCFTSFFLFFLQRFDLKRITTHFTLLLLFRKCRYVQYNESRKWLQKSTCTTCESKWKAAPLGSASFRERLICIFCFQCVFFFFSSTSSSSTSSTSASHSLLHFVFLFRKNTFIFISVARLLF